MSTFQIIFVTVCGVILVVAVLMFAGVIPGFRAPSGGLEGDVVLWGVMGEEPMQNFVDNFNKANKTVLTLKYESKDPETFEDDLVEALASGKGPDIFLLPAELIVKHEDKVVPMNFEVYPERTFKNAFIDGGEIFRTKNGYVALPLAVDPLIMYYNRDVFANSGVSSPFQNWSELLEQQKKITKIDSRGNIVRSAVAFGDHLNVKNAKEIMLTLIFQTGNNIIVPNPRGEGYLSQMAESFGLSPSPAESALDFFTQFANPVKSVYTWNRAMPDAKDAFTSNVLATYFGFASELANIKEKNPHLNFDAAVIPQKDSAGRVTFGRIYGLAIAKNSAKPNSGFVAVKLLTDKAWGGQLAGIMGVVPARRDLLSIIPSDPFADVFYRSALVSRGFLDPDQAETRRVFQDMIRMVQSGVVGSTGAVKTANDELRALLTK